MESYRINANDLEEEELNYELFLRGQSMTDSFASKQRTLRNCLRGNERESPRKIKLSPRSLADDYLLIPAKLQEIEHLLEAGKET